MMVWLVILLVVAALFGCYRLGYSDGWHDRDQARHLFSEGEK